MDWAKAYGGVPMRDRVGMDVRPKAASDAGVVSRKAIRRHDGRSSVDPSAWQSRRGLARAVGREIGAWSVPSMAQCGA